MGNVLNAFRLKRGMEKYSVYDVPDFPALSISYSAFLHSCQIAFHLTF